MLVKYWKKCKTSKLPLIGNLHQLNGGPLPHQSTTELSKKYGPAVQLEGGEKFAVVVSSPEAAEEVERKSISSNDESVEEDLLDVLLKLQDYSNQLDKL
ncbi:hypothetical protein POTOM_048703 [Populus tomentosa]|uniref:Uncharacterized protein n=1 Tax=Populus tomentosa TaxID=118781 RepID=A0A8X7YD74_POPTO|nr:hypothetical protein POTOM_048703 [Populus tomentosa]